MGGKIRTASRDITYVSKEDLAAHSSFPVLEMGGTVVLQETPQRPKERARLQMIPPLKGKRFRYRMHVEETTRC